MFALPGVIALIAFIYARPQEFFESLKNVPFLYLFFFLALFGAALDVRLGYSRLQRAPHLVWVALFYVWCLITAAIQAPQQLPNYVVTLALSVALYWIVAQGVQTFKGLELTSAAVLAMVLFVASIGIHQGFAPNQCVKLDEKVVGDISTGKADGRPCELPEDCYLGDAEPGAQYLCEHAGLLGTTSISGRIRYRGVLQDPNELALASGIGIPLAFAFSQRRRRFSNRILSFLTLAIVLVCAVLTRSRGGQFVCIAVLGTYFLKRYGMRGALAGAVFALPLLAFGGRSGGEASASTLERTECWYEALQMFRHSPIYGVGVGQFGEYHYLTAHNSYMLSIAELGFVGMVLFSILIYISFKIPITILQRYHEPSPVGVIRSSFRWMANARPFQAARGSDSRISSASLLAAGETRESAEGGLALLGSGGVAALRPPVAVDDSSVARIWAIGFLAAFCGLAVGIFFLSFCYHYVLWIYMGLSGALYAATKAHDPTFEVRIGFRDLLYVIAGDAALTALVYLYTRVAL